MINNKIDIIAEENYIKTLNKIFNKISIKNRFENVDNKHLCVMDCSSIVQLESKSNDGKAIVNLFVDKEVGAGKSVFLDYSNKTEGQNYSSEYLIRIMNVFKGIESIKITSANGMPLIIEDSHIKIILAPRMVQE